MPHQACVYILSNSFQKLYIGITTNLDRRIAQHKDGTFEGSHIAKYKIDKLVYIERFAQVTTAIAREKQLKKWSRKKKISLIVAENPTWKDLSEEWGKPIEPYKEPKSEPTM